MATTATLTRRPAPVGGRRDGDPQPPAPARPPRSAPWAGVIVWGVVVVAAVVYGTLAVDRAEASLRAAPLMGSWGWRWGTTGAIRILPAVALGAAAVRWGPALAARAPWRGLVGATGACAMAWTVALAASDGWDRLTAPLATRHEYEPFAASVGDLGGFVSGYVAGLRDHPIHVQGHPPGPVVLAWLGDRVGLGGAGWLAVLAIAGWGVATAAVLVAARALAGEAPARRAAPALAVLPAAVWAGTSLDALFAGLVAAGTALAVVAFVRRSAAGALAAGVVLGVSLLFSYGAVVVLAVPVLAVAAPARGRTSREPARWAARLGVGALAVLLAAATAGFWWFDGLAATRAAYWDGVALDRPGWYIALVGNPGALALATGPAVAVGLAVAASRSLTPARARVGSAIGPAGRVPPGPRRAHLPGGPESLRSSVLPAAAAVAVLAADLSQMSRGEVERIWLPLVPWLALAAPGHRRGWLGAQVATALALQLALRSPW